MTDTPSKADDYRNLITSGIGRLERVRFSSGSGPRKGPPALWCCVAALFGPAGNTQRRYFDLRVCGEENLALIQPYVGQKDGLPTVLFNAGDVWAHAFTYQDDDRKGQPGASVKGRLIRAKPLTRDELSAFYRYNITTRGHGYLEAVGSDTCTLTALVGPRSDPDRRRIEANLSTSPAQLRELVLGYGDALSNGRKVFLTFRLSDMRAIPDTPSEDDKAGKPSARLVSTLQTIEYLSVNGTKEYPVNGDAKDSACDAAPTVDDLDDLDPVEEVP